MGVYQYYSVQSPYSSPGKYARLFAPLPTSIKRLPKIIQGVAVHSFHLEQIYKKSIPSTRVLEPNTRYIEKILKTIINLDSRPIMYKRIPQKRFIGSCRDLALLLCSILRYKGIPARIRCGFARYFVPDFYEDHWVCEYFKKQESRWVLVDTELGPEQKKLYNIHFDANDVPKVQFMYAGIIWDRCRKGILNPSSCGVSFLNINGLRFVLSNLIRDFLALNKIELLPWDYTPFANKRFKKISKLTKKEISTLDTIASLSTQVQYTKVLEQIQALYKTNLYLQIGETITSYTIKGPQRIVLNKLNNVRKQRHY